jgi:hypothetical protein
MLQHEARRIDIDKKTTAQHAVMKLANFALPGTQTIELVYDGRKLKNHELISVAKDYISAETEMVPVRQCQPADNFWKSWRDQRLKPNAAEILRRPKHTRPAAGHEEEGDTASHDRAVFTVDEDENPEDQVVDKESTL